MTMTCVVRDEITELMDYNNFTLYFQKSFLNFVVMTQSRNIFVAYIIFTKDVKFSEFKTES